MKVTTFQALLVDGNQEYTKQFTVNYNMDPRFMQSCTAIGNMKTYL